MILRIEISNNVNNLNDFKQRLIELKEMLIIYRTLIIPEDGKIYSYRNVSDNNDYTTYRLWILIDLINFDLRDDIILYAYPFWKIFIDDVEYIPLGEFIYGPIGATGPSGIKGDKGDKGDIGPEGLSGKPGPEGSIGPMGLDGLIGPTGPIGPIGPKGDDGILQWIGDEENHLCERY